MAVSEALIRRLRGMVGERGAGSTYEDPDLEEAILARATNDERGEAPYSLDYTTSPPTRTANAIWIPTYDLHAAAADVWEEKAAAIADQFDFKTDAGEEFKRSQAYEHMQERARYHRARRTPTTISAAKWPREDRIGEQSWIGNLAEPDED